jgi:Zn-dependent peptidase ImmA (M78 family)/DNA-binding XRE family transcriptional regulator
MRVGTPGFVGARLREAREARGLTPQQLADILGVSKQTVSQYETTTQTPRPEIMEKLPAVLNVKSRFFFRQPEPDEDTPLFHRSLKAATKLDRLRAKRRQEWQFEVIRLIESLVELPAANVPDLGLPSDPMMLDPTMVEDAATQLRRYWNLGDGIISDLVLLLENNGIVVSRGELWSDQLDAFSRWRRGRPFVFLGSDKESAVRSRLDAAHELGHIVLHRGVTAEHMSRPEVFKRIEEQAFRFGGAFLLPASSFSPLVVAPSLELFRALKPSLRVSIGGMIKRASQLGLIADPTPLWQKYRRRRWHVEEPLDRELLPEEPRLLRHAVELVVEHRVLSREEMAGRLDIPSKDVEELAGLPAGFLEPRAAAVRLLQLPPRGPVTGSSSTGSTVLPLPTARRGASE